MVTKTLGYSPDFETTIGIEQEALKVWQEISSGKDSDKADKISNKKMRIITPFFQETLGLAIIALSTTFLVTMGYIAISLMYSL